MSRNPSISLKSKTAQAKKDLDTLLGVIKNKQPILDNLLKNIKDAEETLEDGFAQKELLLQRQYSTIKSESEAKITHITNTITVLKEKERACIEINKDLEQQQSTLRLSVNELERTSQRLIMDTNDIKAELMVLREKEVQLNNNIDSLKAQKKNLEDELAAQIMQNGAKTFELQSAFNREKNELELQIDDKKIELQKIQKQVTLNKQRISTDIEELKKKESELIHRENSLIIRTKALEKKDEAFETEVRRWNYLKPVK